MSGEASVGSIIGYLKLDRSDWDAELNAAGAKADELGRRNPNIAIKTNAPSAIAQLAAVSAAVKRLQDAQGAESVAQAKLTDLQSKGNASASQLAAADERLQKAHRAVAAATIGLANAHDQNDQAMRKAEVDTRRLAASADQAKAPVVNLWAALGTIAPAVVPIAGVATGALLGLGAAGVVAVLGVKGISDEFKSGALQGTQYQSDIQSLVNQFTNLKQTAASGLLGGVDQAIQSSGPLFSALNQDVGVLSSQLGTIVAGAAPALLAILNALNPLFVTFGNLLASGATKLEHWATSSDGITKFVAYVQQELPTVMATLGKLAVLFGHIVQAAAPIGDTVLHVLDGLATALNAIPVSVLTGLGYAFVALYPAVKIAGLVSAAVKAMGLEFPTAAAKAEAAALAQTAAAGQVATASAAEAERVAQAKVAEADAAVAAARVIAEQSAGTVLVLQGEADEALLAAEQFAAAMRVEAVAAERTAASVAASSAAASESAAASAAAVRGQAMVARSSAGAMIGIASVALATYAGGKAISNMTEKNNAFAHAMDNSGAATDSFNQALLKTKGAIDDNVRSTVQAQLQQDGLAAKAARSGISVDQLTTAVTGGDAAMAGLIKQWKASGKPSGDTLVALGLLAKQFDASSTAQKKFAASTSAATTAAQSQQVAIAAQNAAAAKLYGLTGTTGVTAYLAAKKSADDNIASTNAQTLAFQLENNAAGLVNQALQTMSGQQLSNAQAQTALDQATLSLTSSLKTNGSTTSDNTAKGVANRQAIEGAASALRAKMNAEASATGSTEKATSQYQLNAAALLNNIAKTNGDIVANNKSKTAYNEAHDAAYVYAQQILKIPKVVKTTAELATEKAKADAAAFKALLASIPSTVYVNYAAAMAGVPTKPAKAAGGKITGPGSGTSDDVPINASNGEYVSTAASTSRNEAALAAGNRGAKLVAVGNYAAGGKVGSITTSTSGGKRVWHFGGQQYSTLAAARNAEQRVDVRVTGTDTKSLYSSLNGSASQISAAMATLFGDTAKLGGSRSLTNRLKADNAILQGEANRRASIATRLTAAQTALNNAVQKYNSDRSAVAGAVTGTFNISSAGTAGTASTGIASGVAGVSTSVTSGGIGVASIISQITQATANASAFYRVLRSLAKKGLSKVLLDQLAQAGPAALPQAQALDAATSGQLRGINAQESNLVADANATGKFMADQMDGAGVQAALGLVNGLKSQDKALAKAMKHLADVMVAQIKTSLRIHSPSLVMHELGAFTGQGFANGIGSQALQVRSQSLRLASAAVPPITRPAASGGGSGGLQLVQHIYPQPGQSEHAIARAAAAEQVWALRR